MNLLGKIICGLFTSDCPHCEAAWTGGCKDPENRGTCIVCANRKGETTGWVWNRLADPFYWRGHWVFNRNLKQMEKNCEISKTSKSK